MLTLPMEASWDDDASNNYSLWVPNGKGDVVDPLQDGGYAEYSFEVLEEGDFVEYGDG